MKAILYFVAAGIVLDTHQDAAAIIHKETGKRVVFRNAHTSGENPEANEGVAGRVPKSYDHFVRYGDDGGFLTSGPTPAAHKEAALNGIGLPKGAPEDREGLKAALEAEGVAFHGNAKLDKLIDLYRAHFCPVAE